MSKPVATDKARLSTYVSDDVKARIEAFASANGCSVSKAIEALVELATADEIRLIQVPEKSWVQLQAWAREERRPTEQQAQWVLENAIREWMEKGE